MVNVRDLFLTPRIDRRRYWTIMPIIALAFVGAWNLVRWSYGHPARDLLWVAGLASLLALFVLGFWVALRRITDTGSPILWLVGLSVGGRLIQAAVRFALPSLDQSDAVAALIFALVLVVLGCVPGQRATVQGGGVTGGARPPL